MAGDAAPDRPLLVLSDTFSSNPLARFLSTLQLLGFTLLLGLPLAVATCLAIPLVAMLFVGRKWTLDDWWISHWWLAFLILFAIWGVVFEAVRLRRRRLGALVEFFADAVVLAPSRLTSLPVAESARVPYTHVGSVAFRPPLTARFRFRGSGHALAHVDVRLLRYTAEDEFDHVIALMAEQAPDHVFSIEEENDRRWSRSYGMAEVWPNRDDVRETSIAVATVLQPDVMARIDDVACHFSMRDGLVRWHGERDWVLQQDVNQVLARNGLVVCQITSTLPGSYDIEFGSGERVSVRTDDRAVEMGHELLGRITTTAHEVGVRFQRPVPNLIAVVVTVAAMRAEYARRNL